MKNNKLLLLWVGWITQFTNILQINYCTFYLKLQCETCVSGKANSRKENKAG